MLSSFHFTSHGKTRFVKISTELNILKSKHQKRWVRSNICLNVLKTDFFLLVWDMRWKEKNAGRIGNGDKYGLLKMDVVYYGGVKLTSAHTSIYALGPSACKQCGPL